MCVFQKASAFLPKTVLPEVCYFTASCAVICVLAIRVWVERLFLLFCGFASFWCEWCCRLACLTTRLHASIFLGGPFYHRTSLEVKGSCA